VEYVVFPEDLASFDFLRGHHIEETRSGDVITPPVGRMVVAVVRLPAPGVLEQRR
jgi:hypothetical protein